MGLPTDVMPGGAPLSTSAYLTLSARIVGAREAQLRVRQAEGREVKLRVRAVLEHLHAVGEAADAPGLRQPARTAPGACRLRGRRLGA